jgi:hypothetical protein
VTSLALVQAGIFKIFLKQPTGILEQRYDKIQTKQKSMASSTDPPFRPLAIRSMTESTPMSSSRARSIDELLGEFFANDRVETFTDAALEQISHLLQNSGRHSYSRVPRIYSMPQISPFHFLRPRSPLLSVSKYNPSFYGPNLSSFPSRLI